MKKVLLDLEKFFDRRPLVVVAGYTGSDEAKVRAHIEELAEIGVAPPDNVPEFYVPPREVLTQDSRIVAGSKSSGEAEPVLIRRDGVHYLTLGSDHTDRELEAVSIAESKAACPKPIAREAFEFGPEVEAHAWSDLYLSSRVDGSTYQAGRAALLPPSTTLSIYQERFDDDGGDLVLFGGTVPLVGGEFVYGSRWEMSLTIGGESLSLEYDSYYD